MKRKKEKFNSEQQEEEYNSFDLSDIDPKTINQFELLWNKYPKKVGKKETLYCYNQAIKNGFNWFKGECWNDEYEINNYYFNDIF